MLLACFISSQLLLVAPPGDIPVQRPGQKPPAEAPAAEPAPAEKTEPAPAGTQPAPTGAPPAEAPPTEAAPADPTPPPAEAAPAPGGGITPLGSAPLEPAPATDADTGGITSWRDAEPSPVGVPWEGPEDEYYDLQPVQRGTGMFITGGLMFGTVLLKQALSPLFCDGDATLNCGSVGWVDRSFSAAAIGLAAGGGWKRGEWAAGKGEREVAADKVRKRRIAGWTFAGLGFAGAAVDLGFASACWQSGKGPYAIIDEDSPFVVRCRSTTTGLVVDAATIMAGVGMAFGLWGNAYRDGKKKAEQPQVTSLMPIVGADHWGVGLGGRF